MGSMIRSRALYGVLKRSVRSWRSCFDFHFLCDSIGRPGGRMILVGEGACNCLEKLTLPPRSYVAIIGAGARAFPAKPLNCFTEWPYKVCGYFTLRLACLDDLEKLTYWMGLSWALLNFGSYCFL